MRLLILLASAALVPPLAAETLSIAKLAPTESVILIVASRSASRDVERLYEIKAVGQKTFGAVERKTIIDGEKKNPAPNRTIGVTALTDDEAFGLDAYLLFLRHGTKGACDTVDFVLVGHYRDGKKIGEERLRDDTCRTSAFHREDGKVVVDRPNAPDDFPPALFQVIVPPRLIEERIEEKNAAENSSG